MRVRSRRELLEYPLPVLIVGVILGVLFVLAVTSFILMAAWNASMPQVFNLPEIDVWTAFLLNVVSGILFKPYIPSGKRD